MTALSIGWEALERDEFGVAEEAARAALSMNAQDGEAFYLLGSALLFQNRFDAALAPLQQAYRLAPARGVGHRLGYCYLALEQFKAAEDILRAEVRTYPDLVHAYNALGVALIHQARPEQALDAFRAAEKLDPGSAEANTNIANVLGDLGRHEEALLHLRKAVEADPSLPDVHHNLGALLESLKRHEEAITAFAEALRLAPALPYAASHLVWNALSVCDWDSADAWSEPLRRQVEHQQTPAAPLVFAAIDASPQEQRRCAELHVRRSLPGGREALWQGERYAHSRIRLAYLSADFCEHATAYLAARLFELHDRSRFETIGLSYGPDDASPMRKRLEAGFERFIDVGRHADADVARMLRDLEVDIAIDLKGHTTGARLGILAHRPAAIQVTYLGFPGTTGAPFIDYLLADRVVVPEEAQKHYSESIVYLPGSYQVNDGQRAISRWLGDRSRAGLPDRAFVYCCFNNSYKITRRMFLLWMRLLHAVPGSVLWLLDDNPAAARRLRQEAARAGIDAARLVFAPRVPHAEHLGRQALADLFLDTLPYNAHTTASDALWGGLPVVTVAGKTFAGRVAASLLRAVGLRELVASTLDEYEQLALSIAREPLRLSELKLRLAENKTTQTLFDTDRFRRNLESAYIAMWKWQQAGGAPRAFAVEEDSG